MTEAFLLANHVRTAPEFGPVEQTITTYEQARTPYMKQFINDDARVMFFTKIIDTLFSYQLNRVLSNGLITTPNNFVLELLTHTGLGALVQNWNSFSNIHSQFCTFGCFTNLFNSVESFLRILYRELGYDNGSKKFISFSVIYKKFISDYNFDKKYEDIFKLLNLIRNCMHNFGVCNVDDEVEYNGVKYTFEKGKFPSAKVVDLVFLLNIFQVDILTFINQLLAVPEISAINLIKDDLSTDYKKQEDWQNNS